MSGKESWFMKNPRLETAQLITQVRQHPCLWDRSDTEYRNRPRKEQAWEEVIRHLEPRYLEMNRTERRELAVLITRKWNNVRDCYKKSRFGSSRSSVSGRPYIYADLLTFLNAVYDPHERTRKTCSLEGNSTEAEPETEETEEQEDGWLSEVFEDMDSAAQDTAPTAAKKPRTDYTRTKDTDGEDGIVSVLVNLIEKEEDEDRAFFKSITPAVKSLSDEDKFVFRIQVMKMLNLLKNRDRRQLKRDRTSPGTDTD